MNHYVQRAIIVSSLTLSSHLMAATVTWQAATNFTNENQIDTQGDLVEARNLGNGNFGTNVGGTTATITLNGIAFTGVDSPQYTTGGGTYRDLGNYSGATITGLTSTQTGNLLDTLEYGAGTGNSVFTLTGLTVGREYRVQVLMSRDQNSNTLDLGYAATVGGTEIYPVLAVPVGNTNPAAQSAIATFTADATSQELHFRRSNGANAEVNAFQLRIIPLVDTDGDGMPDAWETANSLDPNDDGTTNVNNGATGDPDSDGSNNLAEYQRLTDPQDPDSDDDNLLDGVETDTGTYVSASNTGTDPNSADTDGDQLNDGYEVNTSMTDPTDNMDPAPDADTDGDGMPNNWEIANGLDHTDDGSINPNNGYEGDPDGDGLPNGEEYFLSLPHFGVSNAPYSPIFNEFASRAWEARPTKAHVMVIHCHPDDESIFMGGLIPYVTQTKRLNTIVVNMVSDLFNNDQTIRENELRNAVWAHGLRNHPVNLRFKDHNHLPGGILSLNNAWNAWDGDDTNGVADLNGNGTPDGRETASLAMARQIRRYRPEVVAGHDIGGEYGHGAHQACALCCIDAYTIAADPGVDINGLPAWQVKKLYLHNYSSNRLFHDYWQDTTIDSDGNGTLDSTPHQRANIGLSMHVSQGNLKVDSVYFPGANSSPNLTGHYAEEWGLHSTTVGLDTTVISSFTENLETYDTTWAKGDFFENLTVFPDKDSDTLADDWEMDKFGNLTQSPTDNTDNDQFNQEFEFAAGMNPNTTDAHPLSTTATHVQFTPPTASGAGYEGLTRRYKLWRSTDLNSWNMVSEGTATGSLVNYPLSGSGDREFFRLEFILE